MPSTTNPTEMQRCDRSLPERLADVRSRIAAAARRAGRGADDIILVAVTKNASIEEIRELIELGHTDFGENRVQQLVQRAAQIEEFLDRRRQMQRESETSPVRWHMIGRLQRNKVRKVLPVVRLVHSVDSLRLAEEIQSVAVRSEEPVEVLIEVNASGERNKAGVAPAAARHLVEQIDTMINVRPRGLMCMVALVAEPVQTRATFDLCRELFTDIRRSGMGGERFDILSMGMSNDFEVAVECGANIVRVGTAIFGPAPPDVAECGTRATATRAPRATPSGRATPGRRAARVRPRSRRW
jgi:pyridoxal phosphate enzyme (YggS family)